MHLLGFIIRIYHDARSPERHTCIMFVRKVYLPSDVQTSNSLEQAAT